MSLDFGIIYEIMVPKPWTPRSEFDAYHNTVKQIVAAEEAGFTNAWTVEHHFLEEYSHSSSPESFYGYLAAKTSKIRIGHGVRLLPYPYNHPIRVAESAAVLDIMLDGRLEFGSGRSATRTELEGFGIDPDEARDLWHESLQIVLKAWTNERMSWEGKYFNIPERAIIPKPIQQPHPPLWMSASGPDTHIVAGENGLGLLSFTLLVPPEELARRIGLYKDALKTANPIGKYINDRIATFTMVHCAETTEEARATAAHAVEYYTRTFFLEFAAFAKWREGTDLGTYEYVAQITGMDVNDITFDMIDAQNMCIVGDPEECIRRIKDYQAAGCTQLLCLKEGRGISHEQVMKSIKLMGDHVIPHFK